MCDTIKETEMRQYIHQNTLCASFLESSPALGKIKHFGAICGFCEPVLQFNVCCHNKVRGVVCVHKASEEGLEDIANLESVEKERKALEGMLGLDGLETSTTESHPPILGG